MASYSLLVSLKCLRWICLHLRCVCKTSDVLGEISELLPVSWRYLSSRKIPISEAHEKNAKVRNVTAKDDNEEIYSFNIIKLEKEDISTPQAMTPQGISI